MSLKTIAQDLANSPRSFVQLIVRELKEAYERIEKLEGKIELNVEEAIDGKLDTRMEALKKELAQNDTEPVDVEKMVDEKVAAKFEKLKAQLAAAASETNKGEKKSK